MAARKDCPICGPRWSTAYPCGPCFASSSALGDVEMLAIMGWAADRARRAERRRQRAHDLAKVRKGSKP